jgi:hypothetical protein
MVLVDEVVVLAVTSSAYSSSSLLNRTVRGIVFFGFHQLKFGVKSSPPRQSRVDDILQFSKGEGSFSNGRGDENLSSCQILLLLFGSLSGCYRKSYSIEFFLQYLDSFIHFAHTWVKH